DRDRGRGGPGCVAGSAGRAVLGTGIAGEAVATVEAGVGTAEGEQERECEQRAVQGGAHAVSLGRRPKGPGIAQAAAQRLLQGLMAGPRPDTVEMQRPRDAGPFGDALALAQRFIEEKNSS